MNKHGLILILLISGILIGTRSNAQFTTSGSDIYYTTGKVGVGTSTPNTTMQITSTGINGVVIGTTAYPSYMNTNGLYVDGMVRGNSMLIASGSKLNFGASQAYILGYNPSTGADSYLTFNTAELERMRIDNSGNVGIGITAPTAKLHVNGLIYGNNLKSLSTNFFGGQYTGGGTSTTGGGITVLGYGSAMSLTTGSNNTIIGYNLANALTTGVYNIVIGGPNFGWNISSGQGLTSGYSNVIIGTGAGGGITTNGQNTAVGTGALGNAAGQSNTAVGNLAGFSGGSGSFNSFYGGAAGFNNTSGNYNSAFGVSAGKTNTSGNGNTFLGYGAGFTGTSDGLSNATAIGYAAQVTQSNSLILGNSVKVGIGNSAPISNLQVDDGCTMANIGDASGQALNYGTSYMGFNAGRNGSNWTMRTDGTSNGGGVIYAAINGDIYFSSLASTGNTDRTLTDAQVASNINFKVTSTASYAKKLYVTIATGTWPDFVFNRNYRLKPLAEVNSYIEANHHLPGIPTAAEVEKSGQDVGEMNKILVKKVEELTLYLIDQSKKIEKLQQEVNGLKKKHAGRN